MKAIALIIVGAGIGAAIGSATGFVYGSDLAAKSHAACWESVQRLTLTERVNACSGILDRQWKQKRNGEWRQ